MNLLGQHKKRQSPSALPSGAERRNDSVTWLYLPGYLALFLALGAACRALTHFITNPSVTVYLWSALALTAAISFGIQCGSPQVKYWCYRARVLLFLMLPALAVLFNNSVLAPLEAEAEINATMALLVGWASILCVLLIGVRHGDRHVPLAAPLVPALSLFGLLNSLSVDTLVQISFVIFVAAAIYLIVYERMLHRLLARRNDAAAAQAKRLPSLRWHGPGVSRQRLSRAGIWRAAAGYLAACSIWFAAFMGGAALFYYPVEAVLPRVLSTPMGAVRGASAALLDWRGSSSVMELRGGNYPLSDREVLHVEVRLPADSTMGTPPLWRGRVFEQYSDSRWLETDYSDSHILQVERGEMTPLQEKLEELPPEKEPAFEHVLNPASPALVRHREIEAFVEPLRYNSQAFYFPGELTAIQSGFHRIVAHPPGTFSAPGQTWRTPAYAVRTRVAQERLSGLMSARGLNSSELQEWRQDPHTAPTLEISTELRQQLAPVLSEIFVMASRRPGGHLIPYNKVSAIRDYLVENCEYSLSSPVVPATDDAVVFFLTESKRGACDMFASSMALLLRAMNVPSRVATGFIEPDEITVGDASAGSDRRKPAEVNDLPWAARVDVPNARSVSFVIREREAHAWVEYYVPGAGWLTYDPTVGTRTTEMPLDAQIASWLNLPVLNLNTRTLWLPATGLLLILVGVGWSFLERKNRPLTASTEGDRERAQISEAYNQAAALLKRRVPQQRHQTPLEYEAAVNRTSLATPAKQEFAALTYLVMAARYHQKPPRMSDEELQASLTRLRQSLR